MYVMQKGQVKNPAAEATRILLWTGHDAQRTLYTAREHASDVRLGELLYVSQCSDGCGLVSVLQRSTALAGQWPWRVSGAGARWCDPVVSQREDLGLTGGCRFGRNRTLALGFAFH